MQGNRWSPTRLGGAMAPLCLTQRLRDRSPASFLAATIFWGSRNTGLGGTGLDYDCDEAQRMTAINVANDGGMPLTVRIVGLDNNGNEDAANRTYTAAIQPGGGSIPVAVATGQQVQLRPNGRGGWSGFNTYVG